MDIVPTVLELTGVKHPSASSNGKIMPMQGKSMLPLLAGKSKEVRDGNAWLAFELFGNRAVRQGDWKALSLLKAAGGKSDWQLFNLREDPAELHDLSVANPEKLKVLTALWERYASDNGVVVSDAGPFADRSAAN
jgi:arylsulfatase A-like enzyme